MGEKRPLWQPTPQAIAAAPVTAFMTYCAGRYNQTFDDYDAFHRWSVEAAGEFWSSLWDFCGVVGTPGSRPLVDDGDMLSARFFPDASLNFAENLIGHDRDGMAMVFRAEDQFEARWSWRRLKDKVSRLQQAFIKHGIEPGDRIAAMMPNMPETVAAMLAAASIGAVWSSCSPDFGVAGVLDRFGQIEPKLFICCDGYWYNGKLQDVGNKAREIATALSVPAVIVPLAGDAENVASAIPQASTLSDFIAAFLPQEIEYRRLPFSHPLYILFSSGTTGVPKCIVHSAGGVLLQHLKEHRLHCSLSSGDKLFYFTTCGWMMWNWLVTGLASGATLCLYDGSPFAPGPHVLFDYASDEEFAIFGTSAKFIDAVRKSGYRPADHHCFPNLRLVTSTGSPLSPEGFSFVYESVSKDVQLASISGGTDIVSCFVLGIPVKPVWKGEIQGPGLGLAIDVWNDDSKPVRGEKGELVCTKAFPSMPVGFWNDPEGARYKAAYFSTFENVWCHGDFAEWTAHGGLIIHGRSDATLNPGGVRIGTAEIYNQVEQMPEVLEAICIGQDWDDDVRVVLFVRLAEGVTLDPSLEKEICRRIRTGASPRHVPARIVAVDDIPRTKSGKIVELAVREVVHGREVKNKEALANPDSLALFEGLEALQR